MHDAHHGSPSGSSAPRRDPTLAGIGLILFGYVVAAVAGWPQHGRDLLVGAQATHQNAHQDGDHAAADGDRKSVV